MAAPTQAPTGTRWLVADSWEGFVPAVLWPQEWALGRWHHWQAVGGGLDLAPVSPLPAVPEAHPSDMGGDPRVWRVDYRPVPGEPGGSTLFREVAFPASAVQGLPPGVYALRTLLSPLAPAEGEVRVVSVSYQSGRFRVRVELR